MIRMHPTSEMEEERERGRDITQEHVGGHPGNYPAQAMGPRPENPKDTDQHIMDQKGVHPNIIESDHSFDPNDPRGFKDAVLITPKPFDPSIIKHDSTVVLFGKRRTGKSFMMRDILWHKRDVYPYYLVFTMTKINGFWQKIFPERFVHQGYRPEVLSKLIESQEKLVEQLKQDPSNLDENGDLDVDKCEINPWKCVVLDDVISDHHIKTCKILESLFTIGRHVLIAVYLASQYAKGVSTIMRGNIDYLVTFKQQQLIQLESIAQDFLGALKVKDSYNLLRKYAHGHQALVIDVANLSGDPNDVVYVYTAKDPGKFCLGCREFWEGDRNTALVAQEESIQREFIPAW